MLALLKSPVSRYSVPALDRNGLPFLSDLATFELFLSENVSASVAGRMVYAWARRLGLPVDRVEYDTRQAYGLKGDPCGTILSVTVLE